MRIVGFLIIFAIAWAIGSGAFGTSFAAQAIDPYGPWARVIVAVVAVAVGIYLVRLGNSVSVLLGAALIGAAFSLWLPIDKFLELLRSKTAG
jgi:hypothetical protein